MKKIVYLVIIVMLVAGCRSFKGASTSTEETFYATGDLLFVRGQGSAMDDAIESATGSYTHVALVEANDSGVFVIEALPRLGVVRHSLKDFYTANHLDSLSLVDIYRVTAAYDTAALLQRMRAYLGQPYDDYFLPDNGRLYCSELIYECFLNEDGNHLFEAHPMNFLDAQGRLGQYWQEHFDSLGVLTPQGVPGTNPTDMSGANFLQQFRLPREVMKNE